MAPEKTLNISEELRYGGLDSLREVWFGFLTDFYIAMVFKSSDLVFQTLRLNYYSDTNDSMQKILILIYIKRYTIKLNMHKDDLNNMYYKRLDSRELPLLYMYYLSDINECANPSLNDCDPNAKCYNLEGTFECRCKRGYRGDGKTCECEYCVFCYKSIINYIEFISKKQTETHILFLIHKESKLFRILVLKKIEWYE